MWNKPHLHWLKTNRQSKCCSNPVVLIWQIKSDKIVTLESNPVSLCQKLELALQTRWHWKDVDVTACSKAEREVNIAARSNLSHIHSSSIQLPPASFPQTRTSISVWFSSESCFSFPVLYHLIVQTLGLQGWCWTLLPLAVKYWLAALFWFSGEKQQILALSYG